MKASIVRIGNSQGIRIPKVVLEQTRLKGEVELEVRDQQILIRAATKPRQDWGRKFRIMAAKGDDKLLDSEAIGLTSWDKEDWQWK
jgi:antitoxin MazE